MTSGQAEPHNEEQNEHVPEVGGQPQIEAVPVNPEIGNE